MEKYKQYKDAYPNKTDAQIIESLAHELTDKVETIHKLLPSMKMEAEIPELSDEEIIKGLCGKHYDPNNDVHYNLVEGAIWYREQVKRFISDKSGLT